MGIGSRCAVRLSSSVLGSLPIHSRWITTQFIGDPPTRGTVGEASGDLFSFLEGERVRTDSALIEEDCPECTRRLEDLNETRFDDLRRAQPKAKPEDILP